MVHRNTVKNKMVIMKCCLPECYKSDGLIMYDLKTGRAMSLI